MTDPDRPGGFPPVPDASPLDELASALLDGEAGAGEQARAGDPDVAARVAAFESVARLVGTAPAAVSGRARDAAIQAALSALDAEVVPLARRRRPRLTPLLGAAAALALAVLGVGVLVGGGDSAPSDEAATAALEESDSSAGADAPAQDTTTEAGAATAGAPAPERTTADDADGAGEAADSAAGGSAEFARANDLGDLDAPPELVEALRTALSLRPAGAATPDPDPGLACLSAFDAPPLEVYTARIAGTPVVVGVFEAAQATYSYVALDTAACEQVTAGEL